MERYIGRMEVMNRVYHIYTEWEDYKNGMYAEADGNKEELINDAITLLSSIDLFYDEGLKMLNEWIVSAEENMSNKDQNRRAWIGQATCCYTFGVPEIITKEAWGLLSELQKYEANKIADKLIRIYENGYNKLCQNVGEPLL